MGEVVEIPNYAARLERAANYERDTREQHDKALAARNALIHEAIDNKFPQNAAARATKLSAPTITRILSLPNPGSPPEAA